MYCKLAICYQSSTSYDGWWSDPTMTRNVLSLRETLEARNVCLELSNLENIHMLFICDPVHYTLVLSFLQVTSSKLLCSVSSSNTLKFLLRGLLNCYVFKSLRLFTKNVQDFQGDRIIRTFSGIFHSKFPSFSREELMLCW